MTLNYYIVTDEPEKPGASEVAEGSYCLCRLEASESWDQDKPVLLGARNQEETQQMPEIYAEASKGKDGEKHLNFSLPPVL